MARLDHIRVVLVGPLYGGNVGSVCRAMANMGLSDLAVVSPRFEDLEEARMMACAARDLLAARRKFDSLPDAVADCGLVMGATARIGLYREHSRTPREWAPLILQTAETTRVALVFGREDSGLTNEELAVCTQVVQIPSSPGYASLNLAQAVMVCVYELFVASASFEPSQERSPEAPSAVRERMFDLWREALLTIGFMKEEKADHMMLGLRRILSRGRLSLNDARIMMGIARQTLWMARHGRLRPPADGGAPTGKTVDGDPAAPL